MSDKGEIRGSVLAAARALVDCKHAAIVIDVVGDEQPLERLASGVRCCGCGAVQRVPRGPWKRPALLERSSRAR